MPARNFFAHALVGVVAFGLVACSSTPAAKQPLGADCQGQNTACASGQCLTIDSATSVCTKDCRANADCPTGLLCDSLPQGGKVCLPVGLNGRCSSDMDCSAGFRCDTDSNSCYIPVTRTLCAPCTSSKQCPMGGICRGTDSQDLFCTVPCDASGTCPSGFSCAAVDGATAKQCVPSNATQSCTPGKGLCAPCRNNSECGGAKDECVRNLASNERFCGTNCKVDADCPMNFSCTDLSGQGLGPNQCVPNSGTCKLYCDSNDPAAVRLECGFGSSCDTTGRTCKQSTDGSLCAACETDDDCASHNPGSSCLKNNCTDCAFKGETFCSVPCAQDSDCHDSGFACSTVGSAAGGLYCLPKSGSCHAGAGKLGDDCTAVGADACRSGLCLELGASALCSASCAATADCGQRDFQCCARTGTNRDQFDCSAAIGAAGAVCVPVGGGIGSDCSPGQPPCFEGVCLDLGTARLCTKECPTGTMCPTGFSCRHGQRPRSDGAAPDEVPVCFPDGGGDIGADCTFGPPACRSGLCLKKTSGNVCTASCDNGATCPSGFKCRSVLLSDSDTKMSLVCVPLK
jgi:hypothetical protein